MEKRRINRCHLAAFYEQLRREERERSTIEKYCRDVKQFAVWLCEGKVKAGAVTKEAVSRWKEHLRGQSYKPETINGKLSALNKFLSCMGWTECRVKYLKIQRRLFRSRQRELSKVEYARLLETAHGQGKARLALLLETICATGIRVSEVKYITVEAVQAGRAEIALKGKIRTILLPGKLCQKLQKYAKKQKTTSGEIFLTRSGKGVSRRQIWSEMKALCRKANVEPTKVFPHNLRHLFARTFYRVSRDVAKLADVLGHASIETTRIYLISTGEEHERQLEELGLIS